MHLSEERQVKRHESDPHPADTDRRRVPDYSTMGTLGSSSRFGPLAG